MAKAKAPDTLARLTRLFQELAQDPESVAVVARSRLRLVLDLSQPDGTIAVDGRQHPFSVERDAEGFTPDLTLAMTCATADQFFRGTLDLGKALASRTISSRGSIFKMLELRALLDRARELYRRTA